MAEDSHSGRQSPGQERYDDEISLIDLAIVLVRRKWWAIGMFVLVLAAALLYVTLQPAREYTGQAELKLVHVPESVQMQPPPDIAGPLKNELGQRDPGLTLVELSQGVLFLEVQGTDKQEVMALLDKAVHRTKELAEEKLVPWAMKSLNDYREQITEKRKLIVNYQERISGYKERIQLLQEKSLQEKDSESLVALIQAELALRQRLDQEKKQLEKLQKSFGHMDPDALEDNLQAAQVQKEPVLTSDGAPVNLILALSVVLGLMAGVFTAFFAEFASSVRRRMQEQ